MRISLIVGSSSLLLAVAPLASLSGCVNAVEDDLESEPLDYGTSSVDQGMHDCTEHTDTGYKSGSAFSIKVVSVDGKPLQVDTANAYMAMQAAAAHDGVNL